MAVSGLSWLTTQAHKMPGLYDPHTGAEQAEGSCRYSHNRST